MGTETPADRVGNTVGSLSLEEAAIGEAEAAIAEADLGSALPETAAHELQVCGLGYVEEGGDLDAKETMQESQRPASNSRAIDEPATFSGDESLPVEIEADWDQLSMPERLQQLAEGTLEATEPVADRLEALTVIDDRLPSKGNTPTISYKNNWEVVV